MNIKLKIVTITGIIGLCIILSVLLLENNIILPGFEKIEDSLVEKNALRINDALIDKMIAVDSTTNDYAVWDETYYAMLEQNEEYRETGITAGSIERTNIDFAILIRNDGKIVFARERVHGSGEEYNINSPPHNKPLYTYIEENYMSLICLNESMYYNGFLELPEGLAIISSRPILKSDESGPVIGTIIFGQMIDEEFIEDITEQTHIVHDVHLQNSETYKERLESGIIGEISSVMTNASEVPVKILHVDEENISANILLKDIYGNPVGLLETHEYREIYLEGKGSVKYIIKSIIIVVAIFILLQYWFFNRYIISRLLKIEKQILDMHSKKHHSKIAIKGDDELSAFGKAINDSLDLIENSSREKQIILEANPNTYLYVNSNLNIEDYKITGNIKETLDKKKITNLRNVGLSQIFSPDVVNKLVKAREEAKISCRPSKDMYNCKPAEISFKYHGARSISIYEAKIVDIAQDNMCLILLEDITEREKYERQLREANKHLQELDKAKIDFLNIASHELKTPLTAISAYIDILDDYRGKFSKEQLKGLDAIKRNSNQLKTIISNILEISRLDSGRFSLNITEMDVEEKISMLINNLKILSDNKKIKLRYECNGVKKINTDVMRFEEIMNNLVGNAIKFTDKGSVTVKTENGKNEEKGYIVVSVIDTGIGIPKDKIDNLFQKFYQIDATVSRKYGGTGLGLSITKKMIELQGGEIAVKSVPKKGTTFRFTLPINPKITTETKEAKAEVKNDSTTDKDKKKITDKKTKIKNKK